MYVRRVSTEHCKLTFIKIEYTTWIKVVDKNTKRRHYGFEITLFNLGIYIYHVGKPYARN